MKIQHQQLFLKRRVQKPTSQSVQSPKSGQQSTKTEQPVIAPPAPRPRWGVMPTLAEIAANVQHAVAQTQRQEPTKQLSRAPMSTQQHHEHLLEQARQLEAARINKQKEGKKSFIASFM